MLHPREDYARIQDPAGLIPEDEPVFLMRAQDEVAAETVRFWAKFNLAAGGDPELSRKARAHADKMEAWPVKKLADLPALPEPQTEEQPASGDGEQLQDAAAEQLPINNERLAVTKKYISRLPANITTREQVIASAGIFTAEIKDELAIALDCSVDKVPEALADYMGFTVPESETRPGSGVS